LNVSEVLAIASDNSRRYTGPMTQPPAYVRDYSFTDFSSRTPAGQQPGVKLDAEFDAIGLTTDRIRDNLALIQRDDGALANGLVGISQLSASALALLGSLTVSVRGPWVTAHAYVVGDVISSGSTVLYLCMIAHTSGTLATDVAAGKFVLIFDPENTALEAALLADDGSMVKATASLTLKQWIASLLSSTGAALVGFKPTGTGAATRTAAEVMDEFVYASGFTGYDADGEAHTTSDSYAAIMAADAVARARNKELVLYGRPRIKSPIVIDAPTRWRNQGQHYKPGFLNGGSAIIKDASINGSAIRISKNAYATTLEGIGLLGIAGNGGDGIHLEGNRCRLIDCSIQGMGQDGIRIGAKAPDVGINADCFRVVRCSSGYNARHGVNIDDLSGVTNANAGLADGLDCPNNGSHGLYINNAYLGNVFLAPLCEANAGHGIYLDTNAQHNVFTGGDIEANVAGQVYEAVPGANQFVGTLVQGVVWNSTTRSGSFTPTIYGSSAAGAGTYTIQKGRLSLSGNRVDVDILVTWTAHTGTGNMRFTLPTGFLPNSALAAIPDFVSCVVLPNSGGLTVPGGAFLTGVIIPTGQYGALYYFTAGATGLSAFPMCSAGSLIIRASYELNPPVERL
jgi:hypothetical protein